jgi:two-component system, NtrC family, sensor histidine kinase KinB
MREPKIGDRAESLLQLLVRINHDVAGELDLRTVLQRLIFAAMQHVGGERASIIVVDDTGTPVDATIVYGTNLHEHTTRQLKETLERGLAGWVIRNRQAAVVPDTSMDERWLRRPDDGIDQTGPKSAVCVPLVARGRMVGALTIVHSVPGSFGADQLQLAAAIADQASIAVLDARLYSESSRQARIMTALAEGAASFGSSLDMQDVWESILRRTLEALQVETAALGLVDETTGSVIFRAAAGQNAIQLIGTQAKQDQGAVGEALKGGLPVLINSPGEDAGYAASGRFAGVDARVLMLAPIHTRGEALGVLAAINPATGRFDAEAATVLHGLAGLAAATIYNARLYESLEKARQHYRELFEGSIDMVFVTDWEGRITETNRQAAATAGLDEERLHAMNISQLHPIDREKLGRGFEALRRQEAVQYESTLQTADGALLTVAVHARPMEFADSECILWTFHDLTEHKELEELRESLTAMIYHDLRSPLSNLVSSLDLLEGMVGDNDDMRETLEIAEHSARRMNRLIASLLDMNRLESGQPLTAQSMQRPEDIVRAAVREVRPTAESREHTILTVVEGKLPSLWADGDMLERVLINLLENAIKFSKGGTEVEIGARARDGELDFWVQDQGPGIRPADQKRIFEKFARLSPGTNSEGIGLGLAFCKMAVRAHQGRIRVESPEGRGSRFVVTLPAKPTGV